MTPPSEAIDRLIELRLMRQLNCNYHDLLLMPAQVVREFTTILSFED